MIAFQFLYPIFCGFIIQFFYVSNICIVHKFYTFSIPNTVKKTKVEACLVKYNAKLFYLEFDIGGLSRKGAYLKFWLKGEGTIRKGGLIELLQYVIREIQLSYDNFFLLLFRKFLVIKLKT